MLDGTADLGRKPIARLFTLVLFGSGARLFALGSQFVVLLLMSRILPKAVFGDAMTVFALYRIIGYGLGTGFGNLLLFHVARAQGDERLDIRLHRTTACAGAAISGLLAAGFALCSGAISALFGKPGIEIWLVHMAPFALFGTLNFTAMGSLDGRSRITGSIFVTEVVPNAVRLIVLPVIWLAKLPVETVAHLIWISVALPWAWEARRLLRRDIAGLARYSAWDCRYVGLFIVNSFASLQLQGIDMLLVGALFSSSAAADYSIASRLAVLYPFFQQILLRNYTPKVGALLAKQDIAGLNTLLGAVKRWSLVTVCGLMGPILLAAPFLLPMFGDYLGALPVMVALAYPPIVRSIFAGNDIVLKMAGKAEFSLFSALSSMLIIILVGRLGAPSLGLLSVAAGMLLSAALLNPVIALYLGRLHIRVVSLRDLPMVALACALLGLSRLSADPMTIGAIAGAGLVAVAGVSVGLPMAALRRREGM